MINPLSLLVASAFKNAKENGEDFVAMTDEEIANDMMTYDADIEEYNFDEVLYFVKLQRAK